MSCCVELIVLALAAAAAAPVRIPASSDTSICAHATERELNAGRAARLKLKGSENLIVLGFDPAALRRGVVSRATLRLTGAEPHHMIRWVGLSTLATDWTEGTGGYTPDRSGATFLSPFPEQRARWGGDHSTFLDACFGRGGTLWTRTLAARGQGNRLEIPVDPRLVEAIAAGMSTGLVLSDDNGQTMHIPKSLDTKSNLSNNYVFSREQGGKGPELVVEFDPSPPRPPPRPAEAIMTVVPSAHGATGTGGGVEIGWESPLIDVVGVTVELGFAGRPPRPLPRWMLPAAGANGRMIIANLPPGSPVEVVVRLSGLRLRSAIGGGNGFASAAIALPAPIPVIPRGDMRPHEETPCPECPPSVRLYPDLVRIHPVLGLPLEEADAIQPRAGVTLAALRGEWVAFQVVCDRPMAGPLDWGVTLSPLTGPGGSRIPERWIRLYRVAYVRTGTGPADVWGDPLVPLGKDGAFRIDVAATGVPDQTNQTIYVEVFVPADAKPGRYAGTLRVSAGGRALPEVPVRLEVAAATLPVEAAFTFSLNTYDTPGGAEERARYALAHDHRTTLAVLHYSHSGTYTDGCVPPVTGTGAAARVADWTGFDARFGPLLDGTAFADTSRPGAGLDHFYLALSEHYPVPMAEGYRWNALRWEDHWKSAGTVQQGFTPAMQQAWVAVAKDYAAHITAKGWRTGFQVYLNDKYFYKQVDPKTKQPGRGVSFWLLDEPMHADDFLALRFFGDLLRRAGGGPRSPLRYRADVSRPEWGRDLLDDVLDLNVSGAWPEQAALLDGFKASSGQAIWTYGDTPAANTSALAIPAQALDLYVHGIDGYVPWQVLGEDANWTTHATTAVILPGASRGIPGPVATLRLKAYRRAAQDVEYLRLYAAKREWAADDPKRLRLRMLLRDLLPARTRAGSLDDQGAAVFSYANVSPTALESLRAHLRAAL